MSVIQSTITTDTARNAAALAPSKTSVSPYLQWKTVGSRIFGLVLLLPALPVIGIAAVLVRLTSPGPGIFRQTRVGRHGRHFAMYKLRTMRDDAEAETGPVWTQADDPRITRFGHVLRQLHLDELPQLFNVVKGDMALIGPRPERPEFVNRLADQIPGYLNRLAVSPGVTGLAQINLDPDTTIECVRKKLAVDLHYIESAGFWLDLRIFVCTLVRLFGIPGDLLIKPLRLEFQPATKSHCAASRNGARKLARPGLSPNGIGTQHGLSETAEPISAPHAAGEGTGRHMTLHPWKARPR